MGAQITLIRISSIISAQVVDPTSTKILFQPVSNYPTRINNPLPQLAFTHLL